jgi:hypothetical protein
MERKRFDRENIDELEKICALLPPYHFMPGEEKVFVRLRSSFAHYYSAIDLPSFLTVSDIAYGLIELSRLRQASVALIKNPFALMELLSLVFGENTDKARSVALAFYSEDDCRAKEAEALLRIEGISLFQVQGYACVSQIEHQRILRQVIDSVEAANRRAMKDAAKKRATRDSEYSPEVVSGDSELSARSPDEHATKIAPHAEPRRVLEVVNRRAR